MALTLGLDLGTNSIGWALVDKDADQDEGQIVALGVRIFQQSIEDKTPTPKNAKRRAARMARRITARRRRRKEALLRLLQGHGLLPTDPAALHTLMNGEEGQPYHLRRRALDEPLTLHEFGRAVYHLCQRRGFKSNRKAQLGDLVRDDPDIMAVIQEEEDERLKARLAKLVKKGKSEDEALAELAAKPESDDDEGQVKAAISKLKQEMVADGSRTLGEHLAKRLDRGEKARGLYTDRAMYEEEFELLWSAQSRHHAVLADDGLKATAHRAIFHQRPLKSQRDKVGKCTFYPNRNRAMKAVLISQEFRLWQDLAHISLLTRGSADARPLTMAEKQTVAHALETQGEMSWSAFRKLLKLPSKDVLEISLEEGGAKDKLLGNRTNANLTADIPDLWPSLTPQEKQDIVTAMLTIPRKDQLIKHLRRTWGMDPKQAYKVAVRELEEGTASLSIKAVTRILPHLKAGLNYHDACQAAGFKRADQKEVTLLDKLPDPPEFRNPVVDRAVHEVRKVVNALLRRYKPDIVRIEMARDMKLTKKEKEQALKRANENKRANEEAREQYKKTLQTDNKPSRTDEVSYRLWKEQDGVCLYCGTAVSLRDAFSGNAEIDHILPYSQSFDDSFRNKTLCCQECNRQKGNRTPVGWRQGDASALEAMLQRVDSSKLGNGKRKLFRVETVDMDKFLNRQINDTNYITNAVKDFVRLVVPDVQVSKGQATATLRHNWGLESILAKEGEEGKNRDDHRHHAVDALVVACTDRSLFQRLSRLSAQHGSKSLRELGSVFPAPWPSFREDAKAQVAAIVVSHQITRKIEGALHEETAYGPTDKPGEFVYRKPLAGLTPGEVERIRDPKLRSRVRAAWEAAGKDSKKAFGDPAEPFVVVDKHGVGHVVETVRLTKTIKAANMVGIAKGQGREYKFFPKGSNHHLEVIEDADGNRDAVVVSTVEAARRAKAKQPVVRLDHGGGRRCVMALHKNDTVMVADAPETLYHVVKFSAASAAVDLLLRPLNRVDEISDVRFQSNKHLGRLISVVHVSPVGVEDP